MVTEGAVVVCLTVCYYGFYAVVARFTANALLQSPASSDSILCPESGHSCVLVVTDSPFSRVASVFSVLTATDFHRYSKILVRLNLI
jgi:hypothetical protein